MTVISANYVGAARSVRYMYDVLPNSFSNAMTISTTSKLSKP